MPTPQQLLTQAKGRIKQAAVSPNSQGTRGAPGRGGVAARPKKQLDGQASGSYSGPAGPPSGPSPPQARDRGVSRFPGFQPKPQSGASAGSPGGTQTFREPNLTPGGPVVEPAPTAPPKPAWQQLAERGIGGQGSARANKAKLAALLGPPPAAPGPGGPEQAASDAAALGLPAAPVGPRPLPPDAEPGRQAAALQGAMQAFPGFKPRPGGFGGMAPGAPAGLTARPLPGVIPGGGPAPTAPSLGQTISDPADQMGGGGFGGLGRVGAGLAARRQLRPGERAMNELGDPWPS